MNHYFRFFVINAVGVPDCWQPELKYVKAKNYEADGDGLELTEDKMKAVFAETTTQAIEKLSELEEYNYDEYRILAWDVIKGDVFTKEELEEVAEYE